MSDRNYKYGTVISLDDTKVEVRLNQEGSDCGDCALASACCKGEVVVAARESCPPDLSHGARVRVKMRRSALPGWLALAAPLLVLGVVAGGLVVLGVDDALCVIAGGIALATWYAITHYLYRRPKQQTLADGVELLSPYERCTDDNRLCN